LDAIASNERQALCEFCPQRDAMMRQVLKWAAPQPAFRYPRMLGKTAGDLDDPSSALQFFGLSQ
jgi:hypothetical protein